MAFVDDILALETRLAQNSMPRAEMRDPYAIYHRMPRSSLASLSTDIPWEEYFKAIEVKSSLHDFHATENPTNKINNLSLISGIRKKLITQICSKMT